MIAPLTQARERIQRARDDSDVACFYELLNVGEMTVKLAADGLLACLDDDRERHRYRLEYDLIHADGLGSWSSAIDDALTGPASQVLIDEARGVQRELTQLSRVGGPEWQTAAVRLLDDARRAIDSSIEALPPKVAARRWFSDFVALRNRTRGHGATTPESCSAAVSSLGESLELVMENLTLFRIPWVHLRRNLSGKYRVTDLGNGAAPFATLRNSRDHSHPNGIYLWAGSPRKLALLAEDDDLRDFYLPNGGVKATTYERLSYLSDTRISVPITSYLQPPTTLPASETEGSGHLEVVGNVFANLPPRPPGYVRRDVLESDLHGVLTNERHPVVTLVGRGGIGKTSLALEVLHEIAATERFFSIVWFSARDIELLPMGPKLVKPHVLSPDDMAQEYAELVEPAERANKDFRALDHFQQALTNPGESPTLFVFDNFETVRSPLELYRWLDTYVRLPNKILITTRRRDFKGDYWVEVGGMTEEQFSELVNTTARDLGIADLIDAGYLAELYRECDGHPYIAKVLLGELARPGGKRNVKRIMASQDHVLQALFERTFTQLKPAAQRIFLTLSNWRSLVPTVALQVAVTRPENERIDVEGAVDELRRSSLVETMTTEQGDVYISVPLSATLFGRRKLETSPSKSAIEADTEVLRLFGPIQVTGTRHGFQAQVGRLFQNVAERLQDRPTEFERYRPLLEFVAREQPIGWTLLAQMLEELRPSDAWEEQACEAYRNYLGMVPDDAQIWSSLARMCRRRNDHLGWISALVQRAQLPQAPYADVSYAATQVNAGLYEGLVSLDTDEKRILITSLVGAMEKRREEADATDLSRLAWLLIHIRRADEAKQIVRDGLEMDPANPHCRKLAARLKISTNPETADSA